MNSGSWSTSWRSISAGRGRGSGGTGGEGTAGGGRAGESGLRMGDTDLRMSDTELVAGEIGLGTGETDLELAGDFRMDTGDIALAGEGPGGGGSARLGDGART